MATVNAQGALLGIAGTLFGLLVGWMLGTQQGTGSAVPSAAPAASTSSQAPSAPPLDLQRAADLERQAQARPTDGKVRADLGDLYFEAQRHDLAIQWYEEAIKLDRKNPQLHTDLALSLFYTNNADRALKEIDAALAIDAKHLKALLSQGFIRAFGKQDLPGAVKAWEQVIAVSPSSVEAGEARRQIDGLKSAHPSVSGDGKGGTGKQP